MSSAGSEYEIPRHGGGGVAFLGVEFGDALILIGSVFLGLIVGMMVGAVGYIAVPFVGFVLNKWYVEWRSSALPGQLRASLFSSGLVGYSKAFSSRDVVYLGDSRVLNPGASEMVDDFARRLTARADDQGDKTWN